MKVHELITLLSNENPESEVFLASGEYQGAISSPKKVEVAGYGSDAFSANKNIVITV
jgi:hypothetical protein